MIIVAIEGFISMSMITFTPASCRPSMRLALTPEKASFRPTPTLNRPSMSHGTSPQLRFGSWQSLSKILATCVVIVGGVYACAQSAQNDARQTQAVVDQVGTLPNDCSKFHAIENGLRAEIGHEANNNVDNGLIMAIDQIKQNEASRALAILDVLDNPISEGNLGNPDLSVDNASRLISFAAQITNPDIRIPLQQLLLWHNGKQQYIYYESNAYNSYGDFKLMLTHKFTDMAQCKAN
jgi:hypothetical protein